MGLFRRRRSPSTAPTDSASTTDDATPPGGMPRPSEMDQLRAELVAVQERLERVAAERAALDGRVRELTERLAAPAPVVEQRDVDLLRAQFARLTARVDEVDARAVQPGDEVAERLQNLEAWVVHSTDELVHQLGIVDERVTRSTADLTGRVEAVDARVDDTTVGLAARLDTVDARIDHTTADLTGRVEAVDVRVTQVSAELANQLSELGNDVDELSRRAEAPAEPSEQPAAVAELDPEVLEQLLAPIRDAQLRLANEQARYQIAFRQDLAELADRLRRA